MSNLYNFTEFYKNLLNVDRACQNHLCDIDSCGTSLRLTISGVHSLPYMHLALRPCVWAQEVSGVVLQPSHICIHTYTYMMTAHGVYVVRYPTLLK